MKILHIIPDLAPDSGGPVSAVFGMAKAQSLMGHSVTVVATHYGRPELPSLKQVDFHLYSCDFPRWRWSSQLKESLYFHVHDANIVHIHTLWSFPVLAGVDACVQLNKPYILRPCGMLDPWSLSQKRWFKKLYLFCFQRIISKAAAVHFTSEQERMNSAPYVKGIRSFVSPLGVSFDDYENLPDAEAFRKRFPELGEDLLVLFLSRLHYKKQPEVVIRAFWKIATTTPHILLVVAGPCNKNYVRQLKYLVNQLGLNNKVLFTGMLSGLAKQEVLSAASIFVLPSLHENFGISVVEATAAGLPVIISDRINLADDISLAQAGLVCPPTLEELTQAMHQLIQDPVLCERMGRNGKKLARDKFDWPFVAECLIDEYDRILKISTCFTPTLN